jgi:hypothetical protein
MLVLKGSSWRLSDLTVMRSVFVGGEGVISGGRSDKSRESGVLVEPRLLDNVDCGGVVVLSAGSARGDELMIAMDIWFLVSLMQDNSRVRGSVLLRSNTSGSLGQLDYM